MNVRNHNEKIKYFLSEAISIPVRKSTPSHISFGSGPTETIDSALNTVVGIDRPQNVIWGVRVPFPTLSKT